MKELAEKLFHWWRDPRTSSKPDLSPLFEYVGPSAIVGGSDWIYLVEQAIRWECVRLLGIVAEASRAALVFEGVDPVTLLHCRVAWLVEGSDGVITRLIETTQVVERLNDF